MSSYNCCRKEKIKLPSVARPCLPARWMWKRLLKCSCEIEHKLNVGWSFILIQIHVWLKVICSYAILFCLSVCCKSSLFFMLPFYHLQPLALEVLLGDSHVQAYLPVMKSLKKLNLHSSLYGTRSSGFCFRIHF